MNGTKQYYCKRIFITKYPYIALNKMGCLKLTYQDKRFTSFGMAMMSYKQENYSAYIFGMNGQEKDDEVKGSGNSYDFGARIYDNRLGRWMSTDPFEFETPPWTPYRFGFDNPIYWIDSDGNREFPSYKAYVSFAKSKGLKVHTNKDIWKQGHWTEEDRGGKEVYVGYGFGKITPMTDVFRKAANLNTTNLRSADYTTLPERQAYYKWANEHFTKKGFEVKWMGAAEKTVATLGLAMSPGASLFGFSNKEINKFISDGNKLILDDMISRVKELNEMKTPLKGDDALKWDAQTLSDEQDLIQDLYCNLSSESVKKLQSNLETMEGFEGDVLSAADRWVYGMKQMGYTVTADMMPAPGGDYKEVPLQMKK